MKNPKEYVVGFMFNEDKSKVALIRKTHPDWQKGLLNGIGGKIEKDEAPYDAMDREFGEETGYTVGDDIVNTDENGKIIPDWFKYTWQQFLEYNGNGYVVYFFKTIGDLSKLRTTTDEVVEIREVSSLPILEVIPNLRWIIPMAMDKDDVGGEVFENYLS